jgi:hypothetical protein
MTFVSIQRNMNNKRKEFILAIIKNKHERHLYTIILLIGASPIIFKTF